MIPDRIETERLLLRRVRAEDLAAMHGVLSQPDAMRYWTTPAHRTIEESRVWLDRWLARPLTESDDFVIEKDGQVIGKAGAWNLPEVGFLLHPDYWRQGLMEEAMRAVVAHLFNHRDLALLTSEADPRNAGSIGLLTKLGFVETHRAENTLLWGEQWCDSVYFRLDRGQCVSYPPESKCI